MQRFPLINVELFRKEREIGGSGHSSNSSNSLMSTGSFKSLFSKESLSVEITGKLYRWAVAGRFFVPIPLFKIEYSFTLRYQKMKWNLELVFINLLFVKFGKVIDMTNDKYICAGVWKGKQVAIKQFDEYSAPEDLRKEVALLR